MANTINGLPVIMITIVMQIFLFTAFIVLCAYVYDLLFPYDLRNIELSEEKYQEHLNREAQENEANHRKTEQNGGGESNSSRKRSQEEKLQLRQVLKQKKYIERKYETLKRSSISSTATL